MPIMEAVSSFEMLVILYQTALRNIKHVSHLHTHHSENFKYHLFISNLGVFRRKYSLKGRGLSVHSEIDVWFSCVKFFVDFLSSFMQILEKYNWSLGVYNQVVERL
jgi:hypothetical protein